MNTNSDRFRFSEAAMALQEAEMGIDRILRDETIQRSRLVRMMVPLQRRRTDALRTIDSLADFQATLEFSYGLVGDNTPISNIQGTVVWYPSFEDALGEKFNDLRFSSETQVICRPKPAVPQSVFDLRFAVGN